MARIIVGSYMFRYPLGGMMSWVLQYLLGLTANGQEVFFIEKAAGEYACYDPGKNISGNDPSYAVKLCGSFLERNGLKERWCFVGNDDTYYGMTRSALEEVLATADIYVDMGAHGSWSEETERIPIKVLIEGEPGFTQIRMEERKQQNESGVCYDHYFTNGQNIGSTICMVPTAGVTWKHMYHPVHLDLFSVGELPAYASVTSIMNWQSHSDIEYKGVSYGQKNRTFFQFIDLPGTMEVPFELALGKGGGVRNGDVPWELLRQKGWTIVNNQAVTSSFEHFRDYVSRSLAEFRVCKHLHVEMQTGWFSDVTACYLASGRPAIVQNTGFSAHLPTGRGIWSVRNKEEAVEALREMKVDYRQHSNSARELAAAYFDATKVMRSFLDQVT